MIAASILTQLRADADWWATRAQRCNAVANGPTFETDLWMRRAEYAEGVSDGLDAAIRRLAPDAPDAPACDA